MTLNKNLVLIVISILCALLICCKNADNKKHSQEPFLNSSEYKLLLNPEMFSDYEKGFADYWEIIKEVAQQENIQIIKNEKPLKVKNKVVSFWDTENLDLRKNAFLLRYKRKYKGGKLQPGAEYTMKYRNRDPKTVVGVDLTLGAGYTPKEEEIELESDVVYYSKLNGGLDISYSMANLIDIKDEEPIASIGELSKVYPIIQTLGLPDDTKLIKVAGADCKEYMVRPGKLDFGDGLFGRMDMTVWLIEIDNSIISVPEFSFDHPFHEDHKYDEKAMQKCTSFIDKLKEYKPVWTVPGVLKAAVVFDNAK